MVLFCLQALRSASSQVGYLFHACLFKTIPGDKDHKLRKMNKVLVIVGVILLILFFTNPSLNSFKEFLPSKLSIDKVDLNKNITLSKSSNYLIFSTYKIEYHNAGAIEFIGIIGNFYSKGKDNVQWLNTQIAYEKKHAKRR